MKTFKIAAIIAASISAFTIAPAFAQSGATSAGQGHYEWQQAPQFGPRGPLLPPRRVWVPAATQIADCNCDMMKMSSAAAADCMKGMPGMASPSGASS
jgi:opacity protein-like surface antigen